MPRAVECLLVGTGGHASDDAVEQMTNLIQSRFDISPTILLHDDATPDNVLEALDEISKRHQRRGMLFILLFSGHGGIDAGIHAWRLCGGSLTDEKLTAAIGTFHPDSEVFMVSDCCYGAGMLHIRGDEEVPVELSEGLQELIELQREAVQRRLRSFATRAAIELRESGLLDKGRLPIGNVVLAAATDWLMVRSRPTYNEFVRALCQAIPIAPTYGRLLDTMKACLRPTSQAHWIIDAEPDSALSRPILAR
jgi:hypothetical protein